MADIVTVDVDKYRDYSYTGYAINMYLAQRNPFVLGGIYAIRNVIKMYLMSQKGDYGRNLTKGGPLMEILGKPINNTTEAMVYDCVNKAMEGFTNISVNEVKVTRDLEGKGWVISITFTDIYNKYVDTITLGVIGIDTVPLS